MQQKEIKREFTTNVQYSSDYLKQTQMFEKFFDDKLEITQAIRNSAIELSQKIQENEFKTQQFIIECGMQSKQTLFQITKLSKFLNAMVNYFIKRDDVENARHYALKAKQFTECMNLQSQWVTQFSWQSSRIENLYYFSKLFKKEILVDKKKKEPLLNEEEHIRNANAFLKKEIDFLKNIGKESKFILSYSGIELIYLIIAKNHLKNQQYYECVDYSIQSINLINSLIKNFSKIIDKEILMILSNNIEFLLSKKRFLMVKAYNLIGICLEYVYQTNKQLIDEDRFILQREISNYFMLCHEICKQVMGSNDKMTILFQEKINYIQFQRQEQEFQKQQNVVNYQNKVILKPKFTNSYIKNKNKKKKPQQQSQNIFFLSNFENNNTMIIKSERQIYTKNDKNHLFIQNSLLIINKYIEPILKPDRLLRGKWVPSILNITPNELIFKKRFDIQAGAMQFNDNFLIGKQDTKDIFLSQNGNNTKFIVKNKKKTFTLKNLNTKDTIDIEESKDNMQNLLNNRPQTSKYKEKNTSSSNIMQSQNQQKQIVKQQNYFIEKKVKEPNQNLFKFTNRFKNYKEIKRQNNQTYQDNNDSLEKLMYIFEYYPQINQKLSKNLREASLAFIKIKMSKILQRIRKKFTYQKNIEFYKQFAQNLYKDKSLLLDRTLQDFSGQYNFITQLALYPTIENQKQQEPLSEYGYYKEHKFFDFKIYKLFNGQLKMFSIQNLYILQKSFQNYELSFCIQCYNKNKYKFFYNYLGDINFDEVNQNSGVFQLYLIDFIIQKYFQEIDMNENMNLYHKKMKINYDYKSNRILEFQDQPLDSQKVNNEDNLENEQEKNQFNESDRKKDSEKNSETYDCAVFKDDKTDENNQEFMKISYYFVVQNTEKGRLDNFQENDQINLERVCQKVGFILDNIVVNQEKNTLLKIQIQQQEKHNDQKFWFINHKLQLICIDKNWNVFQKDRGQTKFITQIPNNILQKLRQKIIVSDLVLISFLKMYLQLYQKFQISTIIKRFLQSKSHVAQNFVQNKKKNYQKDKQIEKSQNNRIKRNKKYLYLNFEKNNAIYQDPFQQQIRLFDFKAFQANDNFQFIQILKDKFHKKELENQYQNIQKNHGNATSVDNLQNQCLFRTYIEMQNHYKYFGLKCLKKLKKIGLCQLDFQLLVSHQNQKKISYDILKIIIVPLKKKVQVHKIILNSLDFKKLLNIDIQNHKLQDLIHILQNKLIEKLDILPNQFKCQPIFKDQDFIFKQKIKDNRKCEMLLKQQTQFDWILNKYPKIIKNNRFFIIIKYNRFIQNFKIIFYSIQSQRFFCSNIQKHYVKQFIQKVNKDDISNLDFNKCQNQQIEWDLDDQQICQGQIGKDISDLLIKNFKVINGDKQIDLFGNKFQLWELVFESKFYYEDKQFEVEAYVVDNRKKVAMNQTLKAFNYLESENYAMYMKIRGLEGQQGWTRKESLRDLLVFYLKLKNNKQVYNGNLQFSYIKNMCRLYLKTMKIKKFDPFFLKTQCQFYEYSLLKTNQKILSNFSNLPSLSITPHKILLHEHHDYQLFNCQILYRKLISSNKIFSIFYDSINQNIYLHQQQNPKTQFKVIQIKQLKSNIPYLLLYIQHQKYKDLGQLIYKYLSNSKIFD